MNKKPAWYIASVTMGTGVGLATLAALFFVPWLHAKVVRKDYTLKVYVTPLQPLPLEPETSMLMSLLQVAHLDRPIAVESSGAC